MRLIDADALIKENAYASDMWDRETQSFDLPIVEVGDIENAPTIDAVSVLDDGTLVVSVDDATAVTRVLVEDSKHNGSLYYTDDAVSVEWIPCEERLPSEDELVLVSGEYIEYPCVICKGEHVNYWHSKGLVGMAWMPLPKPYERSDT